MEITELRWCPLVKVVTHEGKRRAHPANAPCPEVVILVNSPRITALTLNISEVDVVGQEHRQEAIAGLGRVLAQDSTLFSS